MSRSQSRRDFCRWCAVGAFADALPSLVTASQPQLLIGFLATGHNESASYADLENQLKANLPEYGAGLTIARREAQFSSEQLLVQIDELLALHPQILMCLDLTAALAAAKRRGRGQPPIVFVAHEDPLAYGLIQSYAHPGNNLTGITTYRCVDGKMVEILSEAFPARKHFGYLLDGTVDNSRCQKLAEEAARSRGIRLSVIDVAADSFIAEMSMRLAPMKLEAVIAPASAPIWQNRKKVVDALNGLRVPTIYESELFLKEGGLMYYGPIRANSVAQAASYVRKIVHGESAGDLPVEQPTLFELVVNLRAPAAADYGIRPSTLRRADRILQ
jgi:putative ABC transport system substrate-binding protein